MEKTIESRIADIILEKPVSEITIEGTTYPVGNPSIATLILASEIISRFPVVERIDAFDDDSAQKIVTSALHHARHYADLGELAAVLILGAKNLTETRIEKRKRKGLLGWLGLTQDVEVVIDRKKQLAEKILYELSPSVLWELVLKRVGSLQPGDFFVITTSLSEINVLKPTKEVED